MASPVWPSEARCRALIAHANEIILILDSNGVVGYCSPAMHRTLGHAEASIVGNPPFELVHPEDRNRVRQGFDDLLRSPPTERHTTFRVRTHSGEWRHLAADAVNLLDEPNVNCVLVALRDVTASLDLAQQLRHAQKMDALGRLAAGIAHDYNNLLTIILSYVDLIVTAEDAEAAGAAATAVRGTAFRAAALSRQLIAFSRRHPVRPTDVDLNAVVSSVHGLLGRVIGEHIAFVCDLDPRAPCIRADVGELEQVLVNLAVNARDAMPNGGTLRMSTRRWTAARDVAAGDTGAWVRLSVSDTGIGMSEDTRARIFEPFFTTKPTGHGSGLGLATAHSIVTEAGGRIHVISAPGAGTTFNIFFPIISAEPTATEPELSPERDARGTETILLVEDDFELRRSIAQLLMAAGYTVIERSGDDGEPRLSGDHVRGISLLIVDEVLTGTRGHELAAEVRRDRPDLAVLYLSGYDPSAPLVRALEEGLSEFLAKPFDAATLRVRVRGILDRAAPGHGKAV